HASALVFACLLGTAACTGGPRYAHTSPTPEPVAPLPDSTPAPVAVEPEKVDEGLALSAQNGTVGRELLGNATYDLPVEPNQWVSMELSFLVNQRHDVVGRWLERGERYSSFVQETFASAGIPRDLHHLAMVESGYQPTARSHAGAVGMWQFMPATGRGMGLRIDDQVDERMDPVRSTRAAARHLKQLYGDFGGSWALAAAAYNAGGGRISRGLANYGARDFWDLATRGNLAQETRRYVPRLYAVTIIAKDPARFGYARPSGLVRRFEFDSVQVDLPTPLPVIARIGTIPLGQLAELNPHLVRGMVPSYYWLWVPRGQGSGLQQAYATSDYRRRGGYQFYTLRRGEDAQKVALASNLTLEQLRELNLSTNLDQLGRGDRIRLYADAARALDSRPVERLASRDNADDEPRSERRTRAASSDDESTSTRRRSSGDGDDSPRRTRTASSDDESSSTRRRSSGDADDSPRRTRTASSDDETSSTRRRSSGDADESPRRTRTTSSDDESSSTRRRSSGDGDDSPRRTRTASSDDETSSTRRRSSGDADDSPRRSRTASSDDESRSSRSRRASDDETPSRRRQEESTSSRSSILRHTVEQGETLMAIGRKYDVTVVQLREANDLGASAVLQPGQRLRIPRAPQRVASSDRAETRTASSERRRGSEETRPERTERSERAETRSTSTSRARQHVVKTGETLWSIARSYDTTVAAIRTANDMSADSVLQPGQTLRIPRSVPARDSDR
ncbi:MAG TPA: LysM peptidoglycan-binding domain-containing protein, partial [Longimicrobium sp.]|nr:LysM peptidoglycan-binding domain-containing protein [Longimicrobium sp.]